MVDELPNCVAEEQRKFNEEWQPSQREVPLDMDEPIDRAIAEVERIKKNDLPDRETV